MRFLVPENCARILIVGAGGFGREVLRWAIEAWPDGRRLIAGFLSDDPSRLDGFEIGHQIIDSVAGYEPQAGDYLLLGIGVPYTRRKIAERLLSAGARFLTLVHPTAIVASTARVGEGSVVCPYVIVSDSARLGRCVLLNYHTSLGHDASVGDFAVLSPYATLGGAASVEEECFLGLHASVGPTRVLGARSKVSVNSCVLSDSPADSIVFGVPGRALPRIDPGVS